MTPKSTGARILPIADLIGHPMNANIVSDDLRAKLLANIKRTGRYPFIVVRSHPEHTGKFQIIDGHHRIDILKELGKSEARCDVWKIDDRETELLLATLNRLEGQDVPIKRAQLVHALLGGMSLDDVAGLIPEDKQEIADLHALLEFPADEVAAKLALDAEEQDKVLPRLMTFVVTPDQEDVIERAVGIASDGKEGRDRKAKGLCNVALHYLEGVKSEEQTA